MEGTNSPLDEAGPSVPVVRRTRRKHAKSRLGCARCKARRIKCDETRPACSNCTERDFPCPGFQQQLRWSNKHERSPATPLLNISPIQTDLHSDLPPERQMNETEHNGVMSSGDGLHIFAADANCSMTAFSPYWHEADTYSTAQLYQSAEWDSSTEWTTFGLSGSQHHTFAVPSPGILQAPVHLPSTLIEYWFRYICPMRSTFDSDINYNRKMAQETWSSSKAVFYTMQAMSAACLLDCMPQLCETLPLLRRQATEAIQQGISQVRTLQSPKVTADLVFAILAWGTSLQWIAPPLLDSRWLEVARELLSVWGAGLVVADALVHAYFCQALTYWEMLLAAVGRGSMPAKVASKRQFYQGRLRRAMNLPDNRQSIVSHQSLCSNAVHKLVGTRPNSWCGVSNEVIDVFGQVLALCRDACFYTEDSGSRTVLTTSNNLCDISLACDLRRELLAMDFSNLIVAQEVRGFPVQTRDANTPVSHLVETAEAYRQAALLQLQLTFSDLSIMAQEPLGDPVLSLSQLDEARDTGCLSKQSREDFLLTLTLQLVTTLEQIPVESGSKSIHPMLYLSAAAGLRFSACSKPPSDFHSTSRSAEIMGLVSSDRLNFHALQTSQPAHSSAQLVSDHNLSDSNEASEAFIPQSTLQISQARRLIWTRLNSLQQMLPHRASSSILQLVKAIWKEYDTLQSGSSEVYWFNILRKLGPEVMLG